MFALKKIDKAHLVRVSEDNSERKTEAGPGGERDDEVPHAPKYCKTLRHFLGKLHIIEGL